MRAAWRAAAGCLNTAAEAQPILAAQPTVSCIAEHAYQSLLTPSQQQVHLSTLAHQQSHPRPWQPPPSSTQPQQTCSFSSQAPQSQSQKEGSHWKDHTRSQFSIRPSLMSPLYSTYLQEIQRNHRRKVLSNLLDAHMLLANEIDGLDASQVEQTARHRAASLQLLSKDLRSLAARTNVPTCTDRRNMMGFFALLEQQLSADQGEGHVPGGRAWQANAQGAADVDDAQLFYQISHGQVSVWDAWENQFALRYAGSPSLPPIEEIYMAESPQTSTAPRVGETSWKKSPAGQLAVVPSTAEEVKSGARMDASGTVLAEGKRKTSLAKIYLREGQGRFTVNGYPYDVYFTELAHRSAMLLPLLQLTYLAKAFDFEVEVAGSGKSAQAQAVRTALARAMLLFHSKVSLDDRPLLRMMARWDGRRVERKKPGQRKARARFTYVRR